MYLASHRLKSLEILAIKIEHHQTPLHRVENCVKRIRVKCNDEDFKRLVDIAGVDSIRKCLYCDSGDHLRAKCPISDLRCGTCKGHGHFSNYCTLVERERSKQRRCRLLGLELEDLQVDEIEPHLNATTSEANTVYSTAAAELLESSDQLVAPTVEVSASVDAASCTASCKSVDGSVDASETTTERNMASIDHSSQHPPAIHTSTAEVHLALKTVLQEVDDLMPHPRTSLRLAASRRPRTRTSAIANSTTSNSKSNRLFPSCREARPVGSHRHPLGI